MKFSAIAVGAFAILGTAFAQDNDNDNNMSMNNTTPCSKYSAALFGASNGTTQLNLLTALVNTAVIGNYSAGAMNPVTGILNPGRTSKGEQVNLLGYFNGSIVSTNRDGKAVSLNFLDGGGADPLKMNKPADDDKKDSNQYKLLTHLYQYFGALLGCSADGFPEYQGSVSQSAVHRYMNLDLAEVTYFIEQVGAAATSFGVTQEDVTSVANTLSQAFNVRCAPPMKLPADADEAYSQSICLAADCPLAPNSNCGANSDMSFPNGTNNVEPERVNSAGSGSGGSGSGSGGSGDSATGISALNAIGGVALLVAGAVAITL